MSRLDDADFVLNFPVGSHVRDARAVMGADRRSIVECPFFAFIPENGLSACVFRGEHHDQSAEYVLVGRTIRLRLEERIFTCMQRPLVQSSQQPGRVGRTIHVDTMRFCTDLLLSLE